MPPADTIATGAPHDIRAVGGPGLRRIGQRPTEPCERLVLGLLKQMAPAAADRFDGEHVEALRDAARRVQWGRHTLDLRLGLPLGARRAYLVIVGGMERRADAASGGHGSRQAWAALAILVLAAVWLGLEVIG